MQIVSKPVKLFGLAAVALTALMIITWSTSLGSAVAGYAIGGEEMFGGAPIQEPYDNGRDLLGPGQSYI